MSGRKRRRDRAGRTVRAVGGPVAVVGPAIVALVGAAMVAWTWRTWPDAVVDFGREVYLPWRLASGETLYVDVRHFSGPLSPYLNALWFRMFGTGIMTVALANLALAAAFVALVYWLVARLADRFTATVASVVFIVTFGCGQYTVIGNYNWLCPYSHDLTHGVIVAMAGLGCVARHQDGRRLRWSALAGLAAGLLVLTKVETMVAGIPAIAVALGLTVVVQRPPARRVAAIAGAFVGGALAPLVATWLWFAPVMTPAEILAWPLGHWTAAQRGTVSLTPFYRQGLGIDDVWGSLARIGVALAGWVAVVGAAVLLGRSRLRHPLAVLAAFAAAAALGRVPTDYQWAGPAVRPFPVLVAVVIVAALLELRRRHREPAGAALALRVGLAVFALGMLAKMALNVRIYQYGFALAAPAAIVIVAALVGWLPAAVAARGGHAPMVRAVVLGFLAACLSTNVATTGVRIAAKTHLIGRGGDAFWTDARGVVIARLLAEVEARVGTQQTLVAFPEGVLVNYLARRRNPVPYFVFDQTNLVLWGERNVADALKAHPPDWMALVDRGDAGLYARDMLGWIDSSYRVVWRSGGPLFTDRGLATALMARAAGQPAAP